MLSKEDDVAMAELEVIIHCESHFSACKDGCVYHWAQCTKTITKASHAYQSCIDWFLKRMRESERESERQRKNLYLLQRIMPATMTYMWFSLNPFCHAFENDVTKCPFHCFTLKSDFTFFFFSWEIHPPSIINCFQYGFQVFQNWYTTSFGWIMKAVWNKKWIQNDMGCNLLHCSSNSPLIFFFLHEWVTGLKGKMRKDVKKITKLRIT